MASITTHECQGKLERTYCTSKYKKNFFLYSVLFLPFLPRFYFSGKCWKNIEDWRLFFSLVYQGSFDHVKVGPSPALALHNLWRQIHIFLEPCVNCVTKCITAKIYPMKVRILETFFLSSLLYQQFSPLFNKCEATLSKHMFLNNFFCYLL